MWSWVKKGIPMRVEIGPRDIAANQIPVARRDRGHKEITRFSKEELLAQVTDQLEEIQQTIFERALTFRNGHIQKIDTQEEFYSFFTPKNGENPEIHGGFALAHWAEDPAVEEKIKQDLSVTIRCIPLDGPEEEGVCPISGKKSRRRVIYAKSY